MVRAMSRSRAARLTVVVMVTCGDVPSSGVARATDGLEPIGVSMKANARGGADVAVGDTALSQIENPAALGLQARRRARFDFTGQLGFPICRWRGPLEEESSHVNVVALGSAALAFPVGERWTLGLALHSRSGLASDYQMRHLLIPFMDREVGARAQCFNIRLNVAYDVSEQLAIGGGLRVDFQRSRFSTVLGPADFEFGQGRAVGGGFQLGLLYRPRRDLTLGLSYWSPSWMSDLEGGEARASILGIAPVTLGDASIVRFRLPQRIAAGVAWDATERLKLVGEARWLNYGNSVLNDTPIRVDGLLDFGYPLPLGYRDQWAFMAGAEYKLTRHWIASGGYHYCTAPVAPGNLLPMGSVLPQHHLTAGVRYEEDVWWLGMGYVLGLPESLRGNGRSRIPLAFDYGFSELEQTQHILFAGFGVSW